MLLVHTITLENLGTLDGDVPLTTIYPIQVTSDKVRGERGGTSLIVKPVKRQ